ncbi:hypothetical protein [Desulfosporosinus sp.]|uniref:hypothetical protein n=1 Tax=Desulfosporosinus sp. TaxID=157907 RepID=UPI0025B8A57C|nr:hypothetical protein [Desulfosporosinus sp.]MBC2726107.1 hypothetical protein [Desulfosporosinus sp.]
MDIHMGSLAQGYAVSIEHILCNVFNCERFGYGGIVNSDFIRKQPFTVMACGFSFIYANAKSDKQKEIIEFINNYSFFSEMSIDTLLSFDTSTKEFNGITIEISYKNGQEAVEIMIEDFRKLCRK